MNLVGVMENLLRVTGHLEWKLALSSERYRWFPTLALTVEGKPFRLSACGDLWRAFVYRPGRIPAGVQPAHVIQEVACLFGRFSAATVDLGGPDLIVTQPGFHDLGQVIDQHSDLLAESAGPKKSQVEALQPEIERTRLGLAGLVRADGLDTLDTRVVHNDTKLSNALLDSTGEHARGVLDLDLVMHGPVWHDFGDLLRSACWYHSAKSSPAITVGLFQHVLNGFLSGAAPHISAEEVATFAAAGPRLAFELGLRYLNDHLRERPQLRVAQPDGHLARGSSNLMLAAEMLKVYDVLRPLVDIDPAASYSSP